jgi:hypothetical protein
MKAIVGLFIAAVGASVAIAAQAQSTGTETPASAPAVAPVQSPAAPPASSPTGPNSAAGQVMVCRTGTLIGSRLPGPKVCKTQWQWDEQHRIARKEIDHDQIRGYSSN